MSRTQKQDCEPFSHGPLAPGETACGGGAAAEGRSEDPAAHAPLVSDNAKSLFDSMMGDGLYVADERYRLRHVSPAIRKQFGEPGERLCYEYLHGLPSPCSWCKNEMVFRGEPVRWECTFDTVGKYFDLSETLLPSHPGDAGPRSKVVIFRDVTRQRKAEEALLESQRFNATIIKSLGEGLVVYDSEMRYTVWNPFMEELTGIPAEAILGKKAMDVFPHLEAKGVDLLLERALAGETVVSPEIEYFVPQTGKRGWVVGVYSPHLSAGGQIRGVVGLVQDVTERKRTVEALRKSERELRIMNRVSKTFLSAQGDDLYTEVLQVALEALESRFGLFGYIDQQGDLVCPSMSREIWDRCQIPDKSVVFPRDRWAGLWGRSLAEMRTLVSNGPLHVPEGHIALTRAVCAPIVFRSELLGLIAVANKATDYDAEDVGLLETIARHIASILFARSERDRQTEARRRAEDALQTLRKQLTGELGFSGIVGRDPRMVEVFETIREVASVDV
ncbi:MAG: PAS domain-containing protein, partial [Planctomycetes bacterium]|nr:PAS domain-containing protein [Planctomycetota bacterium]